MDSGSLPDSPQQEPEPRSWLPYYHDPGAPKTVATPGDSSPTPSPNARLRHPRVSLTQSAHRKVAGDPVASGLPSFTRYPVELTPLGLSSAGPLGAGTSRTLVSVSSHIAAGNVPYHYQHEPSISPNTRESVNINITDGEIIALSEPRSFRITGQRLDGDSSQPKQFTATFHLPSTSTSESTLTMLMGMQSMTDSPDGRERDEKFKTLFPHDLRLQDIATRISQEQWFINNQPEPPFEILASRKSLSRFEAFIKRDRWSSHECISCSRTFCNLSRARDHVRAHFGYKPYNCNGGCGVPW